jgi:hypothetical protein
MLPLDYPDDFDRGNLLDVWFRDIPWRYQQATMDVNSRLRVIRNPATSVFVFVLKLQPEDPEQNHPFFGTAMLRGWLPMMETAKGEPVDGIMRRCEGMKASEKFMREHYGETPEQIEATLRSDYAAQEKANQDAMLANTAFTRRFANEFRTRQLAMSVSDAKGLRLYEGARREFDEERQRRKKQMAVTPGGVILPDDAPRADGEPVVGRAPEGVDPGPQLGGLQEDRAAARRRLRRVAGDDHAPGERDDVLADARDEPDGVLQDTQGDPLHRASGALGVLEPLQ